MRAAKYSSRNQALVFKLNTGGRDVSEVCGIKIHLRWSLCESVLFPNDLNGYLIFE
jgi:hypothetical protein